MKNETLFYMPKTFARAATLMLFLTPFVNSIILAQTAPPYDPILYQAMEWRNIGPFRGGRSVAVAGIPSQKFTYYFGGTGGGVWKTDDAGETWRNVSDGFFKTGSVGAITVAESDPNVVYVGMGEHAVRGVTTSHGDGVYRSTDAGRTWQHLGLELTRAISRIRVHPANPDLVYVAAQGAPYGPTDERGIYRSNDGGETWELVLKGDQTTGASDFAMDRTNPPDPLCLILGSLARPVGGPKRRPGECNLQVDRQRRFVDRTHRRFAGAHGQNRHRRIARRSRPCVGFDRGGIGRFVSLG